MSPNLTISGAQERLTPEQFAEADRFAMQCFEQYRSTDSADEQTVEELLWQTYEAGGQEPPRHIHWLDGPLALVAVLAQKRIGIYDIADSLIERIPSCVWDDCARAGDEIANLHKNVAQSIDFRIRSVRRETEEQLRATFGLPWGNNVMSGARNRIRWNNRAQIGENIGGLLWRSLGADLGFPVSPLASNRDGSRESAILWHSICAYEEAEELACLQFFDTYYAPNRAHALAHFNRMVCGYWFSGEVALLVRRPTTLTVDSVGRLHNETSRCIAFPDEWGAYGWHGTSVSEHVILAPETLTRASYLASRDRAERRIIQERMGQRFAWEMQARFIDGGSRGVLYEVPLPGDPEVVARYVQVQDTSTGQEYFVRVPPTIATAAEAVAWSFGLSTEEYHPAQEA